MTTNFDDVGNFHEKFGLDNVTHRGSGLRDVTPDLLEFRRKFMREELKEFEDAMKEGNVVKMFDALLDLTYVAMGTAHLLGLPWQEGWDEVQRANMAKVRAASDGSDSMRGSSWDVIKPPGWQPPDLETVLFKTVPTQCTQCHRFLKHVTLREVIVDFAGKQWVSVHCPCGRPLMTRPA